MHYEEHFAAGIGDNNLPFVLMMRHVSKMNGQCIKNEHLLKNIFSN